MKTNAHGFTRAQLEWQLVNARYLGAFDVVKETQAALREFELDLLFEIDIHTRERTCRNARGLW